MAAPLADRIRPQTLQEVVGQKHILGEGKVLYRIVQSGYMPNLIFYGPPGVGKTTVARILAKNSGKSLHHLNGTTASTADIKEIVAQLDTISGYNGIVLYLDEIQYLNKKQQQTLLEFIENGSITLIASTTENPYFYIYNAILSRSTVLEFKPLNAEDVKEALNRGVAILSQELSKKITVPEDVLEFLAGSGGGDVRKSLNALEVAVLMADMGNDELVIDMQMAKDVSDKSSMRYDKLGDEHYDILSAFQKSVRGSNENAALHYLARLLEAGDLLSACRRLLVMASEDIGLAYPNAVVITKACVDSALQLGLPEARIPLAQAVIMLCTAPKSNKAIIAIERALEDVRKGTFGEIPAYLRDAHYQGAQKLGRGLTYQYPHNFPNAYVEQEYMPDGLVGKIYYEFGDNKVEQAAKAYREKIMPKKKEQ